MAFIQDEVGRCDFLDVLEEAAVRKQPVTARLKAGEEFTDTVMDVVTENHKDYAVFKAKGRIPVLDIASCTRAKTTADIPLDNAYH